MSEAFFLQKLCNQIQLWLQRIDFFCRDKLFILTRISIILIMNDKVTLLLSC